MEHRARVALAAATVVVFLLTFGAPSASADIATLVLGFGSSGVSGYAGPFATVEVNRTSSTTAEITYTTEDHYLLGAVGAVAFNVNAVLFMVTDIIGLNSGSGFSPGPYTVDGARTEDGWGLFNQSIRSLGGYTHAADQISFLLTNQSGTWAQASDVLIGNALGQSVAAHIFVCAGTGPCDASVSALATGFAAVPEPNAMLLLAFMLGSTGIGVVALRRFV